MVKKPKRKYRIESTARFTSQLHRVTQNELRSLDPPYPGPRNTPAVALLLALSVKSNITSAGVGV
jgi:hypothetical protein